MSIRRRVGMIGSVGVGVLSVLGGCGVNHSPTEYAQSAYLRGQQGEEVRWARTGSTPVRRGTALAASDGLGRSAFVEETLTDTTPVRRTQGPTAITGVDPQ